MVIHSTDFGQARHENEDGSGIRQMRGVFETYSFQKPQNEIIWNQALVQEVDCRGGGWGVSFLKSDGGLNVFIIFVLHSGQIFGPVCPIFPSVVFVLS
jgi:hypothetical protein